MSISIIKSKLHLFIGFIVLTAAILLSLNIDNIAYADNQEGYYNGQRVFDDAGLLTQTEAEAVEKLCKEYGEDAGIDIIILTHNDKRAVIPESYIENFEDSLPVGDRIYFLYDNPRQEIFMEGYGKAETYIHSKRIDIILDNMVDDLRAKRFAEAFETYIKSSAAYMSDDSELNWDHNYTYDTPPKGTYDDDFDYSYGYDYGYDDYKKSSGILTNIVFQIFASFAIGAIVVAVMAYNSGGKMTVRGNDYLDTGKSGLIGKRDTYIRTTVTKVRRPQQSSSSSRGGYNSRGYRGGSSSSGRSHSSGGRKL